MSWFIHAHKDNWDIPPTLKERRKHKRGKKTVGTRNKWDISARAMIQRNE